MKAFRFLLGGVSLLALGGFFWHHSTNVSSSPVFPVAQAQMAGRPANVSATSFSTKPSTNSTNRDAVVEELVQLVRDNDH